MMKKIFKKISFCLLSLPLTTILPDHTKNNIVILKNNDSEIIKTSVTQYNALHWTNAFTYNIDNLETKQINFNQKIKNIYVGSNVKSISGDKFLNEITQTTSYDLNEATGSYNNANKNYDRYERVQDWEYEYKTNLIIDPNEVKYNWSYTPTQLFLKNIEIWSKGTNYKKINGKVQFKKDDNQSYIYDKASDISLHKGWNRELINSFDNFYGVGQTKLKESLYFYLFNNFVCRYLWFIQGEKTRNPYSKINITNGINPKIKKFSLSDFICLTKPSYIDNCVYLQFNYELFNLLKDCQDSFIKYNSFNWSNISEENKQWFYFQLIFSKINNDNIDNIYQWLLLNPNADINSREDYLNKNISIHYEIAKKFNILPSETIWDDYQELIKKTSIDFNYKILDKNTKRWTPKQIKANYESLQKGIKIIINKNENSNLLLKIDNIKFNELITNDLYISEDNTNQLFVNSPNICLKEDNTYEIKKPETINISFQNIDSKIFNKYYCSQVSDELILSTFVKVVDSYNNILDGNSLEQNQTKIIRDEINGQITLKYNFNNQWYQTTLNNFKKPDLSIYNFDASKYSKNLFPEQINSKNIVNILSFNDFDIGLINEKNLKIDSYDNLNGKVNFTFNYLNQKYNYSIINLNKYYLIKNTNIPTKYLNLKPSEIDLETFKKYFIKTSDSFKYLTNLEISLIKNDQQRKLDAKISYYDYFSNEKTIQRFTYFFNKKISWLKISFISLITLGLIIIFLGLIYWKIKLSNNTK